ncbi:MAG: thiol protease/hemagglutinin PrtT [Bacteroidota bacterium]|nr:thiol protease/hemagglutinin PrtT [Bacteroidota bacterium]
MNKNLLFIILLLSCFSVFAKPVDVNKAQKVAFNFLSNYIPIQNANECILVYTEVSKSYSNLNKTESQNYFYIFNYQNKGFAMVSADDVMTPVFAYSYQNNFETQQMPPQVVKWLEGYKEQVRHSVVNGLIAETAVTQQWNQLLKGILPIGSDNLTSTNPSKRASVSPLLTTTWNQSPHYNALCPLDNTSGQRTVSGCVATAMTQVMKYWNYPTQGTGNHTYSHSKYGNLSANFGATTYNWSSMPNSVSSANSAVATLTYHVGVSVDMNYGIASTGGSGAYVITNKSAVTNCAEYALKTYFGYKTSLSGVERDNYTQTQWLNLLKTELNASRPIIYAGFGGGGGHAFVADGYDNNDYIHFNWGWGGNSDGYFSINALNPAALGTGGGNGGFNSGHQAIIGVEPPSGGGTSNLDMRLYSAISISSNPVIYSTAFSVTANLANFGTTSAANFNGDFAAAVFNSSNQFVDYIETKTGISLEFQKYLTSTFSTTGMSSLTPGTYTVGMYYRKTGTTQWTAFANGNYTNFVTFTVEGNDQNPLKLYAPITTDPTTLVQNQTFDIHFDIANFDASNFNGTVSVDLHSSNGAWIRELAKQESLSLQAGYHFTNGLTFTIDGGLTEDPGTYQLFIWSKANNGNWEYVGTGNYSNPVNIQLVAPGLPADIYEVNNTSSTAYALPLNFINNIAKTTSVGSNCHTGTDYDYYKLELPAGYQYSIRPRIHDAYKATDGKTYTLDAVFSYSKDGTNWSDAFDSELDNSIITNGGTSFYILVSPYFTGDKGTYLLDISTTRSTSTNINDVEMLNLVEVYPNPTKGLFNINWSDLKLEVNSIEILDMIGQKIETFDVNQTNQLAILTENYSSGVYTILIKTSEGVMTKKITIYK